jgi:ubiquinone/menaquinone biosynthesis C-methylase UbiE
MSATRTAQSESYLSGDSAHVQWESDYLNPDLDRLYELAFDRIVDAIAPARDATILDAGCGYCFHAIRLARRGLNVTGVDFSDSALREARLNIERAGLVGRVRVEKGDLLALPFPSATFDHVHCWGVLMHIPEVEKALGEFTRVLKPGGKMVLMENAADSLHVRAWEPALRAVKKLMGRSVPERRRTARGVEEWHATESGGLMVRKTNISWLTAFCDRLGFRLVDRFPSQFTEIYANLPGRPVKRAIYRLNQLWFEHVRSPRAAMGNVLVFQHEG